MTNHLPSTGTGNGDAALYGLDLFGNSAAPPSDSLLGAEFKVPPFSVLNARDGWWQERKRAWLALGIRGEAGRRAAGQSSWNDLAIHRRRAESTGKIANCGETATVFDPVLCELVYSWFLPAGGQIIDPFAGGSVRGIVAHVLGYKYWGCDLRAEQIEENETQALAIVHDKPPVWVCADALEALPSAPQADMIFSCPPYGDLERYSDDPRDLSAMTATEFDAAYSRIVALACCRLKPDRFAAFLVGDYRGKDGHYQNLPARTVEAFAAAGLALYNEAILVLAVGSLPLRVRQYFKRGRKLGKAHQNLLIFVKGDWRKAVAACNRTMEVP